MEMIDLKVRTACTGGERGAVRESASNGMAFGKTHGLHIIFLKIKNRYSYKSGLNVPEKCRQNFF